jgi:5-methylcytosine-specific restriction enzyme A
MVKRSVDFWIIAFFLSKYGNTVQGKDTLPPIEFNTTKWKDVYKFFYNRFGDGRSIRSFENSLKNCRDTFDSHINNSTRQGWIDSDNKPFPLPPLEKSIFNKYNSIPREAIWHEISDLVQFPIADKTDVNSQKSNKKRKNLIIKPKIKNPDWTREELILALDLYFDLDQGQMHKSNPDVIRISNELRDLNIHQDIPDNYKFRNPSSVSRRLGNFKTLDSGYQGEGLVNSGKLAKLVWKEFNNHRDKLKKEADLIRQLYLPKKSDNITIVSEKKISFISEFLFLFHKNRESDPLINKVKGNDPYNL